MSDHLRFVALQSRSSLRSFDSLDRNSRAANTTSVTNGGSGSGVTPTGGLSVEDKTERAFEVSDPSSTGITLYLSM